MSWSLCLFYVLVCVICSCVYVCVCGLVVEGFMFVCLFSCFYVSTFVCEFLNVI